MCIPLLNPVTAAVCLREANDHEAKLVKGEGDVSKKMSNI
jgi:hypothetical protein